ncbi:MAG: polysaccharide biosynthesis/export family protein [Planctomycetaceae bacterium]
MHRLDVRNRTFRWVSVLHFRSTRSLSLSGLLLLSGILSGCAAPELQESMPVIEATDVPRELDKVTLPPYRVEPPDILLIEALHNVRPAGDLLRSGDQLLIRVSGTIPLDLTEGGQQLENEFKVINGMFMVENNGTVDLGPIYGSVQIAGLTFEDAKAAITTHLTEVAGLTEPQVSMSLPNVAGKQNIAGEHLVRPDGTVSLGVYGSFYVTGKTLDQIKDELEVFLAEDIDKPEVNVDVIAYNSKKYYVITDGGGIGEQVVPFPYTGNETVLDAIAGVNGLSTASSKNVWLARPAPAGTSYAQKMPVDYRAISQDGITTTNYQIMPGDRVYIKADGLIIVDNFIAKAVAPMERLASFTLVGYNVVRRLQQSSAQFNRNSGSGGGGGF